MLTVKSFALKGNLIKYHYQQYQSILSSITEARFDVFFLFLFFVVCIMKYFIDLIYELYISLKRSVIFHSVTSYLTVICYSHYFVCACPQDVLTIQLELGHQADFKREISPNGFTHDWSVFVRGQDGAPIQHFVEKVVFHLHETFKNPKRGKL